MGKEGKFNNTPLVKALNSYYRKKAIKYHMPAHKSAEKFKPFFKNIYGYDITELSFSDNLHDSDSVIKQTEQKCAEIYGCKRVKISATGSTTGILSAIYAVSNIGDKIIIARSSHKSVYNAIKICGLTPVIIDNERDYLTGLFKPLSYESIEYTLNLNDDAVAVVITTPDYYGNYCTDIDIIAKFLKQKGKYIILDSAHGAHLPFLYSNENYFKSTETLKSLAETDNFIKADLGLTKYYLNCADIYICSLHKTLPANTGASTICINNENLYDKFCLGFSIFHTTSPSYIVMSSIDFATDYMLRYGVVEMMDNYLYFIKKLSLYSFKTLSFLVSFDFCKLTIFCKDGKKLSKLLEENNIYAELSGDNHVLLILSSADSHKDYNKTIKILKKIDENFAVISVQNTENLNCDNFKNGRTDIYGKNEIPFNKAYTSKKTYIKIEQSVGKISATEVGLYPPGLPLLITGDKITKEVCEYLLQNKSDLFGVKKDLIAVCDI